MKHLRIECDFETRVETDDELTYTLYRLFLEQLLDWRDMVMDNVMNVCVEITDGE